MRKLSKRKSKNGIWAVKKSIRSRLSFNRFVYSVFVLFMLLFIYVATTVLVAVAEDLNNAMAHDKKLKDKYNLEMERHEMNPDRYPQPMRPEYITLNVFLMDLPYIIFSISIYIGIYIFILLTFFWLFPPLLHYDGRFTYRIGGIAKIVSYNDSPYVVLKSSYLSKPLLVSLSTVEIKKKFGTWWNSTTYIISNKHQFYAREDEYGNTVLTSFNYQRKQTPLDEFEFILSQTLQKGVSRVKTASKSNYAVAIHKELIKFDDQLLEEAKNALDTEMGDL